MDFSARVVAAREHAKLTQEALAKAVGVSQQAIQKIESGKSQASRKSTQIAVVCGVRPEWLADGSLPMLPPSAPESGSADDDWADVTGYAQAAGLGSGPEAQEWAETHKLKFRRDSLAKKRLTTKNLAVMYGSGDSMEPTIRAGDAILFDMSDTTPKHRGIYVLLLPGAGAEEYAVKRALVSKGIVNFAADNPDGDHAWREPRELPMGGKVIGRVRWTGGWVR